MTQGGSSDSGVDFDNEMSGLASVVRIDRREDVAAICGRVDTAPTFAVVIHAPEGNRQLATELGMRRLARHGDEVGKLVAIATPSTSLSARARQMRIPVARQPENVRWDAGGRRVLRLGRRNFATPAIGGYFQAAVIAAIVVAIGVLALTMAPSATVTAYPATETLSQVVIVTASKGRDSIDARTLKVPAQEVSASRTLTLVLPVTGKVLVGTVPAKAAVVLTNPGAEVTIPAGTVLLAGPDSFAFLVDRETKVAAGGSAPANVTALRPGTAGNVAAETITAWRDERFRGIAVTNAAAAAGGLDEERAGVDAKDIAAIKALAEAVAKSESIKQELVRARPHDAVFLNTAETTLDFDEPATVPGSPADYVMLDVQFSISALAVVEPVLNELAQTVLHPPGGGQFIPGSVSAAETGARRVDSDTGDISTELRLQGAFARNVAPEALKDAVKGKSSDGAKSTLAERYGIQDAEVKVSPGWAPRLPRFGFRISVELKSRAAENRPAEPKPNDASATPGSAPTPNPRP